MTTTERDAAGARATPGFGDRLSRRLRGFGPLGLLVLLVIVLTGAVTAGGVVAVPVSGFLVLGWAWLSHTPWRDLGYVRPRSWVGTVRLSTRSRRSGARSMTPLPVSATGPSDTSKRCGPRGTVTCVKHRPARLPPAPTLRTARARETPNSHPPGPDRRRPVLWEPAGR